jgi:hypothetical protein
MSCKEKVIGGIKMNLCSNFEVDKNKCAVKDIQFASFIFECPYQKTCKLFRVESLQALAIMHDDKIKALDNTVSMLSSEYDYLEKHCSQQITSDLQFNDENFKFVMFFWLLGLTFVCIMLAGHALVG